jgi:hypothetical protein
VALRAVYVLRMGVSTLQSLVSSAQAAIASSDWSSAENYLLQAQTHLIGMPDADSRGESLKWQRTIDDLLDRVQAKMSAGTVSAGGAIQRTNVKYINTPNDEDDT